MPSVFLDSDIILDVLACRHQFHPEAAQVLTLIETNRVTGYTSSLIFANLFYILRKLRSKGEAIAYLQKLHSLVKILAVDERCIAFALNSAFTDFEDAIQYYTAKQHRIKYLITRNIKDYAPVSKTEMTV